MNPYETIATVESQGQVHLNGVPFAPGTEVEVSIRPKCPSGVGLQWEGNVLVHQGVGGAESLAKMREDDLTRLCEGRPE
jgi:hypothetical protein